MRHQIYRFGLIILVIFGLFAGNNSTFASVPPHPRIKKLLDEKKIPIPYYLQNRKDLLKRGVNAPWASPEIQKQSFGLQSGLKRSLGPSKSPSGSYRALVLLVKFSDKTQSVGAVSFDSLIFGNSIGTVRNYYKAVSYNQIDIVTLNFPSSLGWVTAPHTYAYYVNNQNGFGAYPQNAQKLVEDVIAAADSMVDFSNYDNDHDGYVDALFVVHTGPGAEYTGSSNDIWSHAWTIIAPQVHDGVTLYRYSMEPEYWTSPGDMTCGVYAHELGHAGFGLPDLYDTDYSSEGLGDWTLMAGGSWSGANHLGESPAFPDAWSQFQMGFLNPTNVTAPLFGHSINNAETTPEAFRLWTNGSTGNQYFLVQNRQKVGYDSYIPGSGLLVYHVDESVSTDNDDEWYPGHTSSGHYLVALEQADGLYELEKGMNRGNSGDPYPGSTMNTNFTSVTLPNSDDYAGSSSNVSIRNISTSSSVMTADLQVGLVPGKPLIAVSPDTLAWGAVSVGYNKKDTVFIQNGGAEPLIISDITSTLPEYTPSTTSFTVLAGGTQSVVITFAPTGPNTYDGTLSIASNDTAHAMVQVILRGKGEYPPAITVAPDSFAVELNQNDSTLRTMTIGNTGTGNLDWSAKSTYLSNINRVLGSASSLKGHVIRLWDNAKSKSISGESNTAARQVSGDAIKVYTKPAFAPSGGGDIAILGADGNGGNMLADVAYYFNASGKFNSVTTINGFLITPTLSELQAYTAVIVFGWNWWADNAAIGDLLANYIDAGGNVLVGLAANATGGSWMIGGKFNTSNYWLIQPNPGNGGAISSLGVILHPEHSIMSGISTVRTYSKLNAGATVAQTATCLANFTDGTPLIAIDESKSGRRVDISFPVFTANIASWGIDTSSQVDELIVNAVEWLSNGSIQWLSFTPASGIVAPGSNQSISVKFSAKDLQGGDYRSMISVTSNDPVNSPKNVPANLHVIGIPIISIVPDTVKAGTAFIGINHDDTIRVKNVGSDLLTITNITSNIPVFSTTVTNFSLSPGREQAVAVRFAPTDTVMYSGILTITSNDLLHPAVGIMLQGQGAYPPVITVTPDSFAVALIQNDSTVRTMTIGNTGQGPLNWSIDSAGTADSITTTFAGGNGQNGNMFDITAVNTITIVGLDVHPSGNTNYEIYFKSGTYLGSENNSSAWTLAASFPGVVAQLFGIPTPLPKSLSITIPAGQTYGFYVTSSLTSVDQNYTNGTTVGRVYISDVNLQVKEGCGLAYPFSGSPFTPRIWNGKIHYHIGRQQAFWSTDPSSGIIGPGLNKSVSIKFIAKDLIGGNYRSLIEIASNDPVSNPKDVPANLHVIGIPIISFNSDTVKAGISFIGMNHIDTIKVKNIGSDLLNITNITSNLPVFTVDSTNFSLLPGTEQKVAVTFTPTDTLVYNGALTISSNDSLHPTVGIVLQGRGAYPPVITVTPDSFAVALVQNDSTVRTMTIGNTGLGDLTWNIKYGLNAEKRITLPHIVSENDLLVLQKNIKASPFKSVAGNNDSQQGNKFQSSLFSKSSSGSIIRQFNVPGSGWTGLYSSSSSLWGLNYSDGKLYEVDSSNGSLLSSVFLRTNPYSLIFDGQYFWVGDATNRIEAYTPTGVFVKYITTPFSDYKALAWDGTNFWFCSAFTTNPTIYKSDVLGNILESYSTAVDQMVSSMVWVSGHVNGHLWVEDYMTRSVKQLNLSEGITTVVNSFTAPNSTYLYTIAHNGTNLYTLDWGGTIYELDDGVVEKNWTNIVPSSGIITSGSTQNVSIKFSAKDLPGGDYRSVIAIASNDPVNNPKNIPAKMHVIGIPIISIVPDTVKAGTAFIGIHHIDTIKVKNIGSDLLNVTNITSSLSVFTPGLTNFSVLPGKEQKVGVTFAPTDTVAYNSILTITSNDSLDPTVGIVLQGRGAYPPVITVSPDSLAAHLKMEDSTTTKLTISNTGLGILQWHIPQGGAGASGDKNPLLVNRTDAERNTIRQNQTLSIANNKGVSTISTYSMASLLASSGNTHVLLWTGYSDNTAGGEAENIMNAILQYKSDVVFDTTKTTSPTELAMRLAQADVFIMPEQENIGDLTTLGSAFSSALTSFVQSGRTIIVMDYFQLGATTFLNGTGLLTINNLITQSSLTAVVNEPSNPLVAGVPTTFTALNGVNYHLSPNGRKIIRDQSSGNNIVTQRDISTGRVIYIGMDFYSYNNDMARLLANAVISSQNNRWISTDPNSGTVAPGASEDVLVKFSAKDLQPGDYRSTVSIISNDPVNNPKNVPANLHVTGIPIIAVTPDTLKYTPAYVGVMSIDTLRIRNIGSDLLQVSSIVASDTALHPNKTSFVVEPGGEENVLIRFISNTPGVIAATMSVMSNDSSMLTKTIPVRGEIFYPPMITATPDSFVVTLLKGDSITKTLTIGNAGLGTLSFSLTEEVGSYQGSVLTSLKESNIPNLLLQNSQFVETSQPSPISKNISASNPSTARKLTLEEIMRLRETPKTQVHSIKAAVLDSWGSDDGTATWNYLNANWSNFGQSPIIIDYVSLNKDNITYADLISSGADVIIISDAYSSSDGWEFSNAEWAAIKQYVEEGHGLIATSGSLDSYNGPNNPIHLAPLLGLDSTVSYYWAGSGQNLNFVQYPHPLLNGMNQPYQPDELITTTPSCKWNQALHGAQLIAISPDSSTSITVYRNRVYISNIPEVIPVHDDFQLLYNAIVWTSIGGSGWLSENPTNGTIAPGATQNITVKFNAKDLQGGDYRSAIAILSNDPMKSMKSILVHLTVDTTLRDVAENGIVIPKAFALDQNYPNPFNPSTTIQYALPARSRVKLQVFNILGQIIMELVNAEQSAGYQSVVWNATVASGIYFYRIEAKAIQDPEKTFVNVKKMMLLK